MKYQINIFSDTEDISSPYAEIQSTKDVNKLPSKG